MISLARVRAMLELFPLDGLRKAAEKVDSPDIKIPKPAQPPAEQHKALVDAFMAALEADTLGTRRALALSPETMWEECRAAGGPVAVTGEAVPVLDAALKLQIHAKVTAYLAALPAEGLVALCAGKASSGTKTAEQSAYMKRWRDRYGKAEAAYTSMRRVYRDTTTSHDYKAREKVALEVEQYVFEVLRETLGDDLVSYSDEPGRTLKSNVDRKPEWAAFVYLAIKHA